MSNKNFYFLFLIVPILTIITFYYNYLTNNNINIGAYFSFFTFIYLILTIYIYHQFNYSIVVFILLFFIYTFFSDGEINKVARANVTFLLTCTTLIFAARVNTEYFNYSRINKFFIAFLLIFIPLFILSVSIHGLRTGGGKENYRVYYDGFINSHSFGYYVISIGYYFLWHKKYFLSFILFSLSFLSGARSVFLLLFFSIVIFNITNIKSHSMYFILFFIIFFFIVSILPKIQNIYVIDSIFKLAQLGPNILDSKESAALSAGRSYMWTLGVNEILQNFNPYELIFGRGPNSAELFTMRYKGWVSWFHNDFLQLTYCYGFLGLGLYIYSILYYFRQSRDYYLLGFILIAGFTNGFYLYDSTQIILVSLLSTKIKQKKDDTIHSYVSV